MDATCAARPASVLKRFAEITFILKHADAVIDVLENHGLDGDDHLHLRHLELG